MIKGYYDSPIGRLEIIEDNGKIVSLCKFNGDKVVGQLSELIQSCVEQLEQYFDKTRTSFDLPLEMRGTEFQKKVWQELLNIPYGTTISYVDLADKIGNKNACRAVGGANHKNPLMILVPCHRVIGKNGDLVGFGGGIEIKRQLLILEGSVES